MIEVINLTTNKIDEEWVKKIAQKVLTREAKGPMGFSIAFVGQRRMRQLNRRYRGENRSTDVLAFPEPKLFPKPSGAPPFAGELLISLRDVKKHARRFRTPFEQEFARVLIHGILHLLGYEHEKSERDAKKMLEKQEYYLSSTTRK